MRCVAGLQKWIRSLGDFEICIFRVKHNWNRWFLGIEKEHISTTRESYTLLQEGWWKDVRMRLFAEDPGEETRDAWIARVRRTVLSTSQAHLHSLTAGMAGRVRECIEKRGGRVHY